MARGFGGGGRRFDKEEVHRERDKTRDRYLIKRMMILAKPYWYLFAIALAFILAVSAVSLARPYIIKIGIDKYIRGATSGDISVAQASQGLRYLGILFLTAIIFEFLFGYLQFYLLQYTSKRVIMDIRDRIFSHVQHLSLSYFDKQAAGRVVTRVTNDPEALNEMFSSVLIGFIKSVVEMVGILIIMFNLSPRLTLVSFMVLPLIVIASTLFRRQARKVFQKIRTKLAAINGFLAEHLAGMKIIQVFNMQKSKHKEFNVINQEYYEANMNMVTIFGIFRPFMDVVESLAMAILLWYGGFNIILGVVEFGTLYMFIDYMGRFYHPIMELTEQFNTLQSSLVSAERVFNLLDESPEAYTEKAIDISQELEGKIETKDEPRETYTEKAIDMSHELRGEIEFKNVWFAYEGENWVLKDISFKIEPGEAAAFVGATGAGKTSIINLLCGFYDYQKGEILIDGINIRDIGKTELRKNIGLVLQDVSLFSGDIETNIRLFSPEYNRMQVEQAARYVNAHDFIDKLPNGYSHTVSEGGTTLSSGQRQLISFARALISDPKILVMDEATSHVDTYTEGLIQDALARLMEGRTTIAIAHRLSTIQNTDKIIVIHKGRIREMGDHQELLRNKGLYYNLYRLQYQQEEQDSIA